MVSLRPSIEVLGSQSSASRKEFNISSNTQDFDHSEKGLRQILYKKLVGAFPEGYMTTGDLSKESESARQYGTMAIVDGVRSEQEESENQGCTSPNVIHINDFHA